MNQLRDALIASHNGDFEPLHRLQVEISNESTFYAFYQQIFVDPPPAAEDRILAANLMVPYLSELENAYNFVLENEDLVQRAASSCIDNNCPEFARVVVLSMARKESVVDRFMGYITHK